MAEIFTDLSDSLPVTQQTSTALCGPSATAESLVSLSR